MVSSISDKHVPFGNPLSGQGYILWLTGLSGSGKTTLSLKIAEVLRLRGCFPIVLDGDSMRKGLCADLGFSEADRSENIRRIGEVACLIADAGLVAIVACISPIAKDRERVRALVAPGRFVEIFLDCPLEVCEKRDPKGLYRRARNDELAQFTGISSIYEPPVNADVHLHTAVNSVEECVRKVMTCIGK
jgi:adenylylsulfate kinase